jgi:hypothetical protein
VDCAYDLDNLDTEIVHEHVLIDNVASSDGARSPEPGSLRLFNEGRSRWQTAGHVT